MRDAIKGLRTVFMSKGVKLVPLDQMVEAITVNRQAKMDLGAEWMGVPCSGAGRGKAGRLRQFRERAEAGQPC